jgi:hypothetical protein
MILTDEHLEAIRALALPIDYGSITIQIGEAFPYVEFEVNNKIRVSKNPAGSKDQLPPGFIINKPLKAGETILPLKRRKRA